MAVQESRLIISIDAKNAERTAKALNSELQGITNNGNRATSQTNALGGAMKSLAGYMAGVVTVGAAISKMDAYTGLQNRLKLVTSSQQELNTAMNDTFAIAQKTASSWDSVAMVYQRFADNADRLNITMEKTAALTETVSKAISVSGGSAASAEAALMQFGQALASGVLRGEEFNSIAEQAPGLLKAIATGLNVNIGELRAMANEGKITGDVLVEALSKAQPYIDDLFNKTDFTIAQSFTQLSNEITKFVGEAGKGSGAAAGLSAAISGLASNLSTIADIAVVGGVALLTKTILTQTVAIYGSITASVARRSALLAELAAQAAASTAEVARTGAIAQFTAMQLVDAKATAARMTGIQRLAYVQATVIPLEAKATQMTAAHTTATAADTVVQNANNAARSRGAMLLRMIGGPIGAITIGVSALAAGYMYLQNRTAEANAKLEEQAKVANKTKEELLALEGAQRKSAQVDLATAFAAQNKELNALNQQFNAAVISVQNYAVKNQVSYESLAKIREISNKVRQGLISQEEAIKQINNLYFVTPDQIKQIKNLNDEYEIQRGKTQNTADAQSVYGTKVTLAGNAASNAAARVRDKAGAMGDDAAATRDAAQANREYFNSLNQEVLSANERLAYMNLGFSKEVIDQINKLQEAKQKALGGGVTAIVTTEEINKIIQAQKALDAVKNKENEIAQARVRQSKARSSAAKQQAKENKAAVNDAERRAQERLQIEYQYADDLKKGYLELDAEIKRIIESGADSSFIQRAQERHKFEEELYLRSLTEQINAYKWSEEEKLNYSIETQKLIARESGKYNEDIKKIVLDNLDAQRDYELAQIQLAKETRMFQMQEAFLSETDAMNQRYALEERRIMQINDVEEREFALKMNRLKKEEEQRKKLQDAQVAWGRTQADMGGYSPYVELSNQRFDRIRQRQNLFDQQMNQLDIQAQDPNADHKRIAEERKAIAMQLQIDLLEIEKEFQRQSTLLNLNYGQQITGSFADIFKNIAGEQSNGYKLMFTAQKAFAIAQSAIAIQQGIAQAFSLPFPLNLVAAATVAAQTASIVANIKSIRAEGFKDGGYTGNMGRNQVAGVVHGQEYVLNAEATKRVGRGTLDALNNGGTLESSGGVNVIINVPQGYKAVQTQSENGVTIDIVENMINQSWGNVNRPNSNESRAIQGAFGIAPKR